MNEFFKRIDALRVPIREHFNPWLGKFRVKKLNDPNFTLISNNCWGGHVYRYFNLPYLSPTIGLYFIADDYVRFVSDLRHYINSEIEFINAKNSHNYEKLLEQGSTSVPIGLLGGDVEIVFLHSHSIEEARTKWKRRCERINWDNIIIKFSEQNYAEQKHLKTVDDLPYKKKIILTSHDYGLKSQVLFKEWEGCPQIPDEITHFRRYVNLTNLVNGFQFTDSR